MLETIRGLKERIEELELLVDSDPTRVYLETPYITTHQKGQTQDSISEARSDPAPEPTSPANVPVRDLFLLVSELKYVFQGTFI